MGAVFWSPTPCIWMNLIMEHEISPASWRSNKTEVVLNYLFAIMKSFLIRFVYRLRTIWLMYFAAIHLVGSELSTIIDFPRLIGFSQNLSGSIVNSALEYPNHWESLQLIMLLLSLEPGMIICPLKALGMVSTTFGSDLYISLYVVRCFHQS